MTEYYKPKTIRYFKDFKRVEPIGVNSSRLSTFKTCPEKYRFQEVLGYKPLQNAIWLTWGGAVHKFREALEVFYSQGKYTNEAIIGLASIEAMKYWGKTPDPDPKDRKFGFMTKARLSDLLIFISNAWLQEKAAGDIKILSAEKSFSLHLPQADMWIEGTPDQWVDYRGRVWGRDFKTTTKQISFFKRQLFPNDQLVRYTWAEETLHGKKIAGQIVDVIYMTRDEGPKFHREFLAFSRETVDRWIEDQRFWKNALDFAREHDIYPQNEKACSFCPFHLVCESQSQMGKEFTLKSKYKFDPWDNLREGTIILGG